MRTRAANPQSPRPTTGNPVAATGTAARLLVHAATRLRTLLVLLSSAVAAVAADVPKPVARLLPIDNAAHLKTFLSTYCYACHGAQKQKKQIRLDQLDYTLPDVASANTFQDVLDVLNLGKMPPEDENQPKVPESIEVLAALTEGLKAARTRLASSGGRIALRHLNAREYAGTLEELFDMKVPRDQLLEDTNSEPFDTIGAGQYFTPYELERYFGLGRDFVLDAMKCLEIKEKGPKTTHVEPENEWIKRARDELAKMQATMARVKASKDWKEAGFDAELSYNNFIKYYPSQERKQKMILDDPEWKDGVVLGTAPVAKQYITRWMPPGATYKLRARGGNMGDLPAERTLLRISSGNGTFGVFSFNGTYAAPETMEMEFETSLKGDDRNGCTIEGNEIKSKKQRQVYNEKYGKQLASPIWLDWVELDGPYYRAPAFFETCLKPVLGRKDASEGEVRDILAKFAYHCFRHVAPQPDYLDGLVALYRGNRAAGLGLREAIADPLALVLSSPAFLYVLEASGGQKQVLDQRQFAIRLAYFLWSAPPDDELYAQAEQGALYRDAALQATVERMLASPKARRFLNGFVEQWADLKRFDGVAVGEDCYQFMDVTRFSARKEPVEFVGVLLQENLPVANLIDSDFVVVDKALAVFYGLPGTFDWRFRKTPLPPGSPRGGLLGQAFFSVMNGNGERSSPVTRGAFVMKRFLDREPPPPPPDVPALEIPADHPLSVREVTRLHESRPQCASCHATFDPIGLALENYSPIGLWRETETVGKQERPIDASGGLPDGSRVADARGLKKALLKNEDSLARQLYEALSSYALGRRMEFTDREDTDAALKALKAKQYRLKDMILSIAMSKNFRTK